MPARAGPYRHKSGENCGRHGVGYSKLTQSISTLFPSVIATTRL